MVKKQQKHYIAFKPLSKRLKISCSVIKTIMFKFQHKVHKCYISSPINFWTALHGRQKVLTNNNISQNNQRDHGTQLNILAASLWTSPPRHSRAITLQRGPWPSTMLMITTACGSVCVCVCVCGVYKMSQSCYHSTTRTKALHDAHDHDSVCLCMCVRVVSTRCHSHAIPLQPGPRPPRCSWSRQRVSLYVYACVRGVYKMSQSCYHSTTRTKALHDAHDHDSVWFCMCACVCVVSTRCHSRAINLQWGPRPPRCSWSRQRVSLYVHVVCVWCLQDVTVMLSLYNQDQGPPQCSWSRQRVSVCACVWCLQDVTAESSLPLVLLQLFLKLLWLLSVNHKYI